MADNPFDEVDFSLMLMTAIVPPHWPWAILLGAQALTRRSPKASAYILDALGWQAEEAPVWLLPGAQKLLAIPENERPKVAALTMPNLTRKRRLDTVGDSNGDGAAEGRTVKLAPRLRPAGPRLLTPEEFAADPLFKALDSDPHRCIIGHTQGGKSSAMHAMAQAWAQRGEPVIVCDPDAARGQWPGCEVAGYAEDYRGIGTAIERVRDAFEERSLLYADGQRDFTPIHLVIDEVHEVFDAVPGAREFVLDTLGRRGAKRGIRVTIGTQDQNKDTLGLESAGVLSNFITAELQKDERGRRVATVYRGNAGKRQHVKQYSVPPLPGAKSFIQAREPEPVPAARAVAADAPRADVVSVRVPEHPDAPDDLLASLLAAQTEVPAISPERAERLAMVLKAAGVEQATVARVERGEAGGDTYLIAAAKAEVPAPTEQPRRAQRPRREGVVNLQARRRLLERKAYYEQAAADGVTLQAAYDARAKGDKGNYNDAARWYKEAKGRIKAS